MRRSYPVWFRLGRVRQSQKRSNVALAASGGRASSAWARVLVVFKLSSDSARAVVARIGQEMPSRPYGQIDGLLFDFDADSGEIALREYVVVAAPAAVPAAEIHRQLGPSCARSWLRRPVGGRRLPVGCFRYARAGRRRG